MTHRASGSILSAATLFPKMDEAPASWINDSSPPGRSAQLLRMDRLCGLALCVADRVLLTPSATRRFDPTTTAVIVGSGHGCHKSDEDFFRGLFAGPPSPRFFAYTLPSSPVGEISIHHGLLGPGLSIVSGRTAGLEAVVQAEELLLSGQASSCLVIGCEVASPSPVERAEDGDLRDGASAILLGLSEESGEGQGDLEASTTAFVADNPAAAVAACVAEIAQAVPSYRQATLICDPQTRRFVADTLGAVRVYETPPCGAVAAVAVCAALPSLSDATRFMVLSTDPSGLAAAALWRVSRSS